MAIVQLRNHLPIRGPARREPADDTESVTRVSLGFEPEWYSYRCDVDFSEQWHTDPRYRHDALVKMKTELCRAFPSVSYWSLDYRDDLWTLSGSYGAFVIPKVFGGRLSARTVAVRRLGRDTLGCQAVRGKFQGVLPRGPLANVWHPACWSWRNYSHSGPPSFCPARFGAVAGHT